MSLFPGHGNTRTESLPVWQQVVGVHPGYSGSLLGETVECACLSKTDKTLKDNIVV